MALSDLILRPKFDMVFVKRTSRGKFPGAKAAKGTAGLVWSTWVSNSNFSTKKLSILDDSGDISFTTFSCVEKIGTIVESENLQKIYDDHVEKHFVPVFCILNEEFTLKEKDAPKSVSVKYLGQSKKRWIKKHCICMKDLKYMHDNQHQRVFSLRIEPWVLKRHGMF